MKKIYLASFLQPENFGPGRVIAIINTNGGKPKTAVAGVFEPFTPSIDLIETYNKQRSQDGATASQMFVSKYQEQLETFYNDVKQEAQTSGQEISEILPFEDGDTLASWERAEMTNFRKLLAPVLEKMGFEVVLK
ncbi:MAG TPA: hypothetical protein VM577_14575 [Anaerovoracaceae bacterium]|nr:hypothetical protein [Anaerovoracaceae bacterium]